MVDQAVRNRGNRIMMKKNWIQSVGAVTAAIMAAGYIQALAAQDVNVTAKDNRPDSIADDLPPEVEVSTPPEIETLQTLAQPAGLQLSEIKVYPVF